MGNVKDSKKSKLDQFKIKDGGDLGISDENSEEFKVAHANTVLFLTISILCLSLLTIFILWLGR